ncbi:MAG: hypothetical protein ACR2MT_09500 [Aurantibacter sp.]
MQAYQQFGYFYDVNLFKRIFDFYLDASVHVALAVFCFVWLTGRILDVSIDKNLAFFLFFGTIASYNFIKYGLEAKKYILVASRYHKNIQFFSFIALGFAMYHAYFLSMETWIALVALALLTGLYALPVLPKVKNLRSLSGFKVFPVALVWAGATVILPVLEIGGDLNWDAWVEAVQRFIVVLVLMLPFEIRDLQFDSAELKTIPQRYGVGVTRAIGISWILAILLITFLKDDLQHFDLFIKAVICLTLAVVISLSEKGRSKYFATFWVEALPIFWCVIGYLSIDRF